MEAFVGTSGYAYDFWKGEFYPEAIKSDEMLGFYAARFSTVEINNTFYRIPKRDVVQRWVDAVPESFRFVIKASRRITHVGRLGDVKDSLEYMLGQLEPLRGRCGPLLIQCPPTLRKDTERLKRFLSWVPEPWEAAMEFRHASWADDDVYDVLRNANAGWVINDDDSDDPPMTRTAPFSLMRLRLGEYPAPARERWARNITASFERAYVFFKHEERAAQLAAELRDAIADIQPEIEGAD